MNKSHIYLALFLFGLVLIVHFQNCARTTSPSQASRTATSDLLDSANPVQSPDAIYQGLIAFDSNFVQFQPKHDLTFEGRCDVDQEGALIAWSLHNQNLLKGQGRSICSSGKFSIMLESDFLDSLNVNCGEELVLKAELGAHAKDTAFLSKTCTAQIQRRLPLGS